MGLQVQIKRRMIPLEDMIVPLDPAVLKSTSLDATGEGMIVQIDNRRYVPEPLDNDNRELNALRDERSDAVKALRDICATHGDNDWDDKLHLGDVIEKHLHRYLS